MKPYSKTDSYYSKLMYSGETITQTRKRIEAKRTRQAKKKRL